MYVIYILVFGVPQGQLLGGAEDNCCGETWFILGVIALILDCYINPIYKEYDNEDDEE